jgi:hypothetical protein
MLNLDSVSESRQAYPCGGLNSSSEMTTNYISSIQFTQARISWGIHGHLKVSLGPAMPYHYALWVGTRPDTLTTFDPFDLEF